MLFVCTDKGVVLFCVNSSEAGEESRVELEEPWLSRDSQRIDQRETKWQVVLSPPYHDFHGLKEGQPFLFYLLIYFEKIFK